MYKEQLHKIKIYLFLFFTKYITLVLTFIYNLIINISLTLPDKYLFFIDNIIYNNTEDNTITFSDDEEDFSKNIIYTNDKYENKINNLLNISKLSNVNNAIFNIIIFSKLIYLNKENTYSVVFTKKIKLLKLFKKSLYILDINNYFNNPNYLFILYYNMQLNQLKMKLIDLIKNEEVLSNQYIMFGEIKL